MYRRALYICFWLLGITAYSQDCPDLLNPIAGSTGVPVDTTISWENVVGVNGYIISLGTTPGGGEIVNEQAVGSSTSYTPPLGLPESTQIHVTITLFFFDLPDIVCPSVSFTTENVTTVPDCTTLISPQDGDENVPVSTILIWRYASKATGYRVTVGTAPGAGDIVNNLDVGNVLNYNPPGDLPVATEIFVSIDPYNENGTATGCVEESFITGGGGDPPGCTTLISPEDGAINVPLSPIVQWTPVAGATGYIVFIGSSPFNNDVVDGDIFFTTSIQVLNFEPNRTYFVKIIPFNDAGQAQNCPQESFSTLLGCGPFFDDQGNLITLNPEIDFPDTISLCEDSLPTRVTSTDIADGFRWYQITDSGDEILISEEPFADIPEFGVYRYEAYNVIIQDGITLECPTTKEFTTTLSSKAQIDFIQRDYANGLFTVIIGTTGSGVYEFSLTGPEGPYQNLEIFTDLPPGTYTVYVRDKNGCGIAEETFRLAPPTTGFPPYFSPNGDGINDFWQYIPPEVDPLPVQVIYVFDRFGKMLDQINPYTEGWDGRYNNTPMPLGGYWYRAELRDGGVITGYFSLIR